MMRCSRAAITAPKRSFGGSVRVMAARPAPRHVMNGKLAVAEAETKGEACREDMPTMRLRGL